MLNCYILVQSAVSKTFEGCQSVMLPYTTRHFWPDDPVNAEPTNKMKRHLKNQN